MLKILCDICNTEIKEKDQFSNYEYVEIAFNAKSQMGFVPHKETYCEKCTDEIKKTIVKLKK